MAQKATQILNKFQDMSKKNKILVICACVIILLFIIMLIVALVSSPKRKAARDAKKWNKEHKSGVLGENQEFPGSYEFDVAGNFVVTFTHGVSASVNAVNEDEVLSCNILSGSGENLDDWVVSVSANPEIKDLPKKTSLLVTSDVMKVAYQFALKIDEQGRLTLGKVSEQKYEPVENAVEETEEYKALKKAFPNFALPKDFTLESCNQNGKIEEFDCYNATCTYQEKSVNVLVAGAKDAQTIKTFMQQDYGNPQTKNVNGVEINLIQDGEAYILLYTKNEVTYVILGIEISDNVDAFLQGLVE